MSFKIMVVDDSAMSRRSLRRVLESQGYAVIEAEDGMSAIERYHLERPDLVMLDMLMKGMYGLEVLEKLRQIDASARVVIVTADIQNSTREMATEAGALAFVNKPFAGSLVLETVATILGEESLKDGIDRTSD
ncbi:MAG TPA: response regulator [Pyrinomonadaceae bacterium]|nr:response regulator [Pyrinomonadaceae bacterium]